MTSPYTQQTAQTEQVQTQFQHMNLAQSQMPPSTGPAPQVLPQHQPANLSHSQPPAEGVTGQLARHLRPTWQPQPEQQPHHDLPPNPYLKFIPPPAMPPALLVCQGSIPEQAELINSILVKDAFNTFCVDCGKQKSTHFNVTFGTFVCEGCARMHWQLFDMQESYVKACLTEHWDKHQLKVAQMYGNKPFFEFLKQYGI